MKKYITNPFRVNQEVICINANFPCVITTEEDKSCIGKIPPTHPKKWEQLSIDEILGEYLRFGKYDNESFMWWMHTHFKPLDEMTEEDVVQKNLELFKEKN